MSREMKRDTFCVTDGQTDTFCVTEELGILVVGSRKKHVKDVSSPLRPNATIFLLFYLILVECLLHCSYSIELVAYNIIYYLSHIPRNILISIWLVCQCRIT